MNRLRTLLSLFTLFLILSGCAQRLDEIEERVTDVQKRTAALEVKTGQPIGSDKELLASEKLADVRSQVTAMRNEITVLEGKAEALEFDNKNLTARMDQLSQDAILRKSRDADSAKGAPATSPADAPVASASETEYNTALRAHQDGDFDKAQKLFESFVSKHPKDPLASHAIFWMGDGYMDKKQYKKAIVKFQDLIEKYPKSEKRCDAIGKQIACLKELKMTKEASMFSKLKASECK